MPVSIATLVVDCDDALKVARFWSELLDASLAQDADQDWATIDTTPQLAFARVPDKTPGKNVIHLDLSTGDSHVAIERAVGLGATRVADHDGWTTLADVEGNVFDVATS
ncbi:VOC family protein [Actinopolymorpha pittospori]|uniref:Glyoxalase-like domain-containing protein n=1 Tax=Actinopolymorpha pittospori TaxID=648752 RepID=A0A927MQD2_9ACTN|nr:VOC family protein [Actinopolymorpha pittospori]MBE1604421.1 hypothetical protein [Actinopolymorpha pittospori]